MSFIKYKKSVLINPKNKTLISKIIPDKRVYYVYRVTNIITNQYYYGSRIKVKDNILYDFWSYCTSSKQKKDIIKNKENYKVKIILTFNNYAEMIICESYLHKKFNVKVNEKFFNEVNQTPTKFDCAGVPKTEEHKLKLSKSIKLTKSLRDNKLPAKKGIITRNTTMINGITIAEQMAKNRLNTLKNNGYDFKPTVERNPKQMNTIVIVDPNNNITDVINISFIRYCKERNYPMNALRKSYSQNNFKLYENIDNGNKAKLIKLGWYDKFKGYSAYKLEDAKKSQILKQKLQDILDI